MCLSKSISAHDRMYYSLFTSDQMQATSKVWQLPPMESFRKCVSLEERYGTCFAFFLDKAMITCSEGVHTHSSRKHIDLQDWKTLCISS